MSGFGVSRIGDLVNAQVSSNDVSGMNSLVKITEKLVERMNEEKSARAADFFNNIDYRRAKSKIAKIQRVKDGISDSVSAASKAITAIGWIEKHIDDMRTKLLSTLGSTSPDDRSNLAKEFDQIWGQINARADGANLSINHRIHNLIGNTHGPEWNTEDVYTSTGKSGGFTVIKGAYLGSQFSIKDTEGFFWRLIENKGVYKQFNSNGSGTGKEISAENMIVNSFDTSENIDSVTISNGTDTITGNLDRGGLRILKSEYYDKFDDDITIQKAIGDIDNAIIYFDAKVARLKGNAAILQSNNELMKDQIAELDKEVADIVTTGIKDNGAKNSAAQLKLAVTVNNLNLVSQNNQGLVQNLLQAAQGPGSAPGIFGLMGY